MIAVVRFLFFISDKYYPVQREFIILKNPLGGIVFMWNYVFNHKVSPLRNIPDIAIRHYILQVLGFMWVVSFSVAVGSYTYFAANIVGDAVLIAAVAITVATWTAAAKRPGLFSGLGRQGNGEHQ